MKPKLLPNTKNNLSLLKEMWNPILLVHSFQLKFIFFYTKIVILETIEVKIRRNDYIQITTLSFTATE